MTEPGLRQPPLVARAHRLLAISSIAPVVVSLAITIMMLLLGDLEGGYVFFLVFTMVCLVIIAWLGYWHFHYTPDAWRINPFAIVFIAAAFFLPMMFGNSEDLRSGLDMPTFSVVAVMLVLGIFFVGWLPAREAARLVLDDLSDPDVVNSSLVIRFGSRVHGDDVLNVTPDSLDIVRPKTDDKAHRSYPLTDISAITVRTEHHERDYPVPGIKSRKIRVNGEVVVIELPAGQLVFPVKDPQRFIRFVEERRAALVGE